MDRRRMKVIDEPSPTRTTLVHSKPGPLIRSTGSRSYACGKCDQTLLHRVDYAQVQHLVIRCPCGAFNEIPRADQTN